MSATIYAAPTSGPEDAPRVGAICDECQAAIIRFNAVAFGSDWLAQAIEEHECHD